jgi:hypothetical protein
MRAFLNRLSSRRFVVRALFVSACVLTLVIAFYVIENSRGVRAWESYRSEAQRKGTHIELSAYLPPPVPDSENFAAIPLITNLFKFENSESPTLIALRFPDVPGNKRPVRQPFSSDPFNAVAWRDFLLKCGWLDSATSDPPRDILRALERHRDTLLALHEAGLRPKSRFPLNWPDGFAMRLPHLPLLQQTANLLALRASAALKLGDTAAAHSDLLDVLRLYRALEGEPLIITSLVRISLLGQTFAPVIDGMIDGRWTDAQLQEFQREFARAQILESWLNALSVERAVINHELLKVGEGSGREFDLLFGIIDNSAKIPLGTRVARSAFPRGWLYQNLLVINRLFDDRIARTDLKVPTINTGPASDQTLQAMIGNSWLTPLRYPFARAIFPSFETVEARHLLTLARAQQVQTAAALARYRRAHGKLPAQLNDLVSEYLPSVPRDPMDGSALRYRPDPEGSYLLWSIGSDRKDDGGKSDASKDPVSDFDWVLKMPKPRTSNP